jgi:hypothetical protein
VQNQEYAGVAATIGVESGLDKPVSGPLSVVEGCRCTSYSDVRRLRSAA